MTVVATRPLSRALPLWGRVGIAASFFVARDLCAAQRQKPSPFGGGSGERSLVSSHCSDPILHSTPHPLMFLITFQDLSRQHLEAARRAGFRGAVTRVAAMRL